MRRRSGRRLAAALPAWLGSKAPRDDAESGTVITHRRKVVAGVTVAGAALLGASLSTEPASWEFYALTVGVASTWTAGGLASGPLRLGWEQAPGQSVRRPVVTPVLVGAGAFVAFYGCALVARRIPVLEHALRSVLAYAHHGNDSMVLLTTLANGLGEEVFFRGAMYAAVGPRNPVALSSAAYALVTVLTRNPALVLAAGVMGTLFGVQRRASGGIQAPILTHLTWSGLMLRYLPPLFPPDREPA